MMKHDDRLNEEARERLAEAVGGPSQDAVEASRQRIATWFAETAPHIMWDAFESPIGTFYVGATARGVCSVVFKRDFEDFTVTLDPKAHLERDPEALADIVARLRAYFEDPSRPLDMPVDLSERGPFHRAALRLVQGIPAGTVWTYKQVAEALGKPRASRAVGQAMARNPVPIIIPCHRVVGSDGALTGYGGGGGIPTKRWLLQQEGALQPPT
jgi:O-6-methylguanine DNA methyltransferase